MSLHEPQEFRIKLNGNSAPMYIVVHRHSALTLFDIGLFLSETSPKRSTFPGPVQVCSLNCYVSLITCFNKDSHSAVVAPSDNVSMV